MVCLSHNCVLTKAECFLFHQFSLAFYALLHSDYHGHSKQPTDRFVVVFRYVYSCVCVSV